MVTACDQDEERVRERHRKRNVLKEANQERGPFIFLHHTVPGSPKPFCAPLMTQNYGWHGMMLVQCVREGEKEEIAAAAGNLAGHGMHTSSKLSQPLRHLRISHLPLPTAVLPFPEACCVQQTGSRECQ